MISKTLSSFAVSTAVVLGGLTAATAEELSFAHFVPPAHTLTASVVEPLADSLAADTNGELTVRVYPGGELGKGPLEQYVRVVQGVADIVWGLPGYTSSQFEKTMIAEMPGAIPDGVSGYTAIWRAYPMLEKEFPATKPLALWTSEPNVFIMKDHDIRTPADVAGLKIRVAGSTSAAVVEALGGTPVQMPAGDIYNALQTGLIDGVITGSSAIGDFKLDEVANSYTLGAPLGTLTFYVVMNQARYDGLTDPEKAAIDKVAGEVLSKSAEDAWNAKADQVIEGLRADSKVTVIDLDDAQAAAFGDVTLPVTEALLENIDGGADVLAAMRGE
ncbi:TRAP transporter substrate-binding protein [Pseudooceanicola spongiae]|jgi:TRAP-type transport system periplasmic protein|uniref:C4-dicarboxylate ABC transporter substrate-binding protein n=1 Tax=Pseudooceanicola spongiae TaxID=2613965 RepID=A0A7L9WHN5_9RHOB|nr:TRAP transporter substrate-binding protein [Pseudooceanicola spongiae]QOL79432.1 C4-dicarboxylate ABC transporter substrate-binding protein [Pseudooceanicola spongiae]